MKKLNKILMPLATIASTFAIAVPLASCSCKTTTDESAKANLTITSTDQVKIKESNVELNKDSTITLTVPAKKALGTVHINVGSTVLKENTDYTIDYNNNVITIKASAMTNKDVNLTIFTTKMSGISVKGTDKEFEALTTIKASDITVYPVYESGLITSNPLTYGVDYFVYDADTQAEIKNFDVVGYTVTRDDARTKSKGFSIKPIDTTFTASSVSIKTTYRYEPDEIKRVEYDSEFVAKGQTITPSDIKVTAVMKGTGEEKVLDWSDTGYSVWEGSTEITDFGTNGYTFKNETTSLVDNPLLIKSKENPEVAPFQVAFKVAPFDPKLLKNTFIASNTGEGDATITWNQSSTGTGDLWYSIDGGDWILTAVGSQITLPTGHTIMFKGNNISGFSDKDHANRITMASVDKSKKANVTLYGSVFSIMDDNGQEQIGDTLPSYCFYQLFFNSDAITSVSKDFLGNKNLSEYCYYGMFWNCTNLVDAPELPATTMTKYCYQSMFRNCTSLVEAPKLPAETLEFGCYQTMFYGCSSLKFAPELPAKKMATLCYGNMFYGCSSLENAPALNSEELASTCYGGMFYGCTSLRIAPKLPATKLADECYASMFQECSSLEIVPDLPATTLTNKCYYNMFSSCTNLVYSPKFEVKVAANDCCESMFMLCTNLKTTPLLSATVMFRGCYMLMFAGCESLKIANEGPDDHKILTGVVAEDESYEEMFYYIGSGDIDVEEGKTYYWVEE